MDTDKEILYLGVLVGWLLTTLFITFVGALMGVPELTLVLMILIGAGILTGLFLIAELISFFQRFKIVRRE